MRTLLAILPYAIGVSLAATILVLLGGLATMARTNHTPRGSNLMMRARIAVQAVTVALIILYLVLRAVA